MRCSTVIIVFLLLAGPVLCHAEKRWYTKVDCELMSHESNDGDSFHVKVKGREYIYRLYFVDAPESDNDLPERVKEQAEYFGIADPRDAVKVGKDAADFTRKFLANGFTVYTKGADAMGRSELDRDYAIVEVDGKDLGIALVEQGLARIFGQQESAPQGPSISIMRSRLKTAERDAKEAKRGAWALAGVKLSKFDQLNAVPDIREQTMDLPRTTPYFSLLDRRHLGNLPQGKSVTVLRAESTSMIRLRFESSPGKFYEVQCRREDLNL
jgi:endonuclease YncB( thermonuclease family)